MKQTSDVQDIGIFSERSPRSQAAEKRLQDEAMKIGQYISRLEGELEVLEKDRTNMLRLMALGEAYPASRSRLEDCVRLIHETRDNLEALKKEQAKTDKDIAGLCPTSEQTQARRALQSQFGKLAKERFAKTVEVQGLLGKLRQALDERIELAGKLRTAAQTLDCEIVGDVLDEARFENCRDSLPDDLLAESERWQSALGLK
jgi:hypothetical protein